MPLATVQSAFAAALLDPGLPVPASIATAGHAPEAARFSVYRNNVFHGLIRALAQQFPVTERLVGAGFFSAMAGSFALGNKPASPVMMNYGGDFPDFIATFAPAASLPYLPDVARIEAAWSRAHHAADAAPLTVAGLAGIAPHDLPGMILAAHPSASLVQSSFPAGSIWAAHQQIEVTPVASASAETVLVVRPALSVCVHILPRQDAEFAAALLSGHSLGVAAERALARHPDFAFGPALVGLINLGAFGAPYLGEGVGK